jgi:enoyl-CoA hydratase/carnithine racemase
MLEMYYASMARHPLSPSDLPLTEITVERPRAGAVVVTLDRPQTLNALTDTAFDELAAVTDAVAADDTARVLVLTGRGRGFCSGLDLGLADALPRMSPAEMLSNQERWARAVTSLCRLPKPVIAAVNGVAAGAGLALALAADVRLAAPEARFNAAFVRIGLSAGDVGVSWLLPRIVGLGHAAEIMFTGRLIDAPEAERIGLVNRIARGDVLDAALDIADEMTANSPFGLRLSKQVLMTNVDAPSLDAALELENRNQTLATRTDDMAEALAAFREKRPPVWTGR